MHRENAFVTLTYSPECQPEGGSLSSRHWREFTKGIGYRYFGCGEYGERTQRPHYHVVLFGIGPLGAQRLVAERWKYGFSHVGLAFSSSVAAYVAAYTTKKMTRRDDERLEGREPEFARMSRRPAVGWPGVQWIVRWLVTPEGMRWMEEQRDVPNVVQVDRRAYPLGRTIVSKLRELCDIAPDDPLRRERRESRMRVLNLDPILRADRERTRHSTYDVLKARVNRKGCF